MSCYFQTAQYIFVGQFNSDTDMIIEKLSKIEVTSKYKINSEYRKIETVRIFRKLLDEIDFSSEHVPIEDIKKLTQLLTFLKGKELNKCETNLVKELIENKSETFNNNKECS